MKLAILIAGTFFSVVSGAASPRCKPLLDRQEGAPFRSVDKRSAMRDLRELSELSPRENQHIYRLLSRADTEVFEPYHSGDMGGYLYIVDRSCKLLWGGFIYYN